MFLEINYMNIKVKTIHFLKADPCKKKIDKQSLMSFCNTLKKVTSPNEEKLLGILLDSKLNFVNKTGQKLTSLARINYYFTPDQEIVLLNLVASYQFSYPLITNHYSITTLASDLQ